MAKTKAKRKATARKPVRAGKPVKAGKPVRAGKAATAKKIVRAGNARATKAASFQPLAALQNSFSSVINYFK